MSGFNPNYIHVKNYFLLGVKVVVQNECGEILLLQRSANLPNANFWSLPGGAVEQGEDLFAAAARETLEETKLTIKNLKLLTTKTFAEGVDNVVLVVFTASVKDSQVKLNWEHSAHSWVAPEQALKLELSPNMQFIIKTFMQNC